MTVEVIQHGGLTLAAFEPKRLRVALGKRTVGKVLADLTGELAVLDGPMYSNAGVVEYHLRDRGAGLEHASAHPTRGLSIYVVDGAAHRCHGALAPDVAPVAVQLYPELVVDGHNVAGTGGKNDERVWRAALCILADGRLAFAVGVGSMRHFAEMLIAAGVMQAGYSDGGGSAELALSDGRHWGHKEDRCVASWLWVSGDEA